MQEVGHKHFLMRRQNGAYLRPLCELLIEQVAPAEYEHYT